MVPGHSPSSLCCYHTHHGIQMPEAGCLSLLLSPHTLDTRSTPAQNSLCATMTSHRWRTTTVPSPSRSSPDPSATSSPACRLRASGRSGRCVGPELPGVRAKLHSAEAWLQRLPIRDAETSPPSPLPPGPRAVPKKMGLCQYTPDVTAINTTLMGSLCPYSLGRS